MWPDLFDFWSGLAADAHSHPEDGPVLQHFLNCFQRECPPSPCLGPLKTAPVVLLFLNPGFSDPFDLNHAKEERGQSYYRQQRSGVANLSTENEHGPAWKWWTTIVKQFEIGEPNQLIDKIAFLNIAPYKSEDFKAWHMLAVLPSSRVCLQWAQSVLFPQARAKDRVVICLRSAKYWGLGKSEGHLFVPKTTMSGFMHKDEVRAEIVRAVQSTLSARSEP
jgi:hypothetical protein